jgi:MFS family permease
MAHHYGERRLSSPELDEEENEEESHYGESSHALLVEDIPLESYLSTKSSYEMLALTIGLAGSVNLPIQVARARIDQFEVYSRHIAPSLQMAQWVHQTTDYCPVLTRTTKDFLLNTGISPTTIASVWIIPPLCGATLQPLFGILSDRLKEKVGRREPFILLGGIGLLGALLTQAWSSTVANSLDGSCEGTWPACRTKIFVSVFAVVVLYASAQAVQVGTRAKMVDECHATQQLDVNTWASRVISLTSVLYYILSYGLPSLRTIELRMQELALISAIIIITAISIACVAGFQAPPPYPASRALPTRNPLRQMTYIQQLKETITTRMAKILGVQFLASFAWFPYLFYISRYDHILTVGLYSY